jgi:hypothetical protein
MPLIRPNDTTQLSLAFERFCGKLEDCIRRDAEDTQGFFTNNLNFNSLSALYRADAISSGLDTTLLSRNRGIFSSSVISDVRDKILSNSYGATMTNMKSTILCAFELTNRGQANRINKQQLYTFLFCLGFPTGLIAKIILNGNVGGVRNGILTHKTFATAILITIESGRNLSPIKKGFLGNENVGSLWENRFFTIASICYKVGGMNLFNKFVNCTDQKEVLSSVSPDYNARNLTKNLLCYGFSENNDVYRINTINLFQTAFEQQRGVRRTGQTLSRNAVNTTDLSSSTALPSASNTPRNSEVRSSVSSEQSRPITTPTRSTAVSPVRDEPLQESIGLEFEVVRPKEIGYREFVNSIVKKFRENGLDVQAEGYNHTTRNYWKLVPDQSISRQTGDRIGGDAGIECVSPVLNGKKGIVDIKKAIRSLVGAGASVNESVGYHAHFGIAGLSIEHLRNLLYNYRGFEPIIDTIMLKNRRGAVNNAGVESRWAKSLYRRFPNENDFWQLLESCQSVRDIQYQVFGNDRYQKTNLMAYSRYGTIEFRQHGGTLEEDTIIYWLYWLHFLIQVSKRKKLSFFDFKQVRNITPVWLSTWMGNRAFDMSGENFNAV